MTNENKTDNNAQPLVRPRDTYQEFLSSGFRFVQRLYDFVTIPLQVSLDGPIPGSADEGSPSAPIFPGSYPTERCVVIESTCTTFDSVHLEEPAIPHSTQSNEALWIERYHEFRDPAAPHELSAATPYSGSEQPMYSATYASEGLGKHNDQSAKPTTFFNLSHSERSHTPIPSQSTIAAQFQGSHGFSVSGNPNFTNIGGGVNYFTHFNNYGGSTGLERAEKFVAFDALHNSAAQDHDRRCHPGTRLVVLNQIRNWIDSPNAVESVFWLHGPAGAGKSAIAQTIAHSYTREHVVATFFFYRSDPRRNNGNQLFITIAWQLAFSIPGIREYIAHSLDNQPDLPMKDVETQFLELIVRPLQELKQVSSDLPSPVVIIDGVDECTNEKLQRRFLKVIGDAVKDNGFPLRFLISSRPEAHIQETIDRFSDPKLEIDLASLDDANHDIEKYFRDEFSRIASDQGLESNTWPGDAKIQGFVYKASGQFAYASTVIKYVDDEYNSAVTQLDIILGLKPQSSRAPFAELDALYMEILERQRDKEFLISFLALLIARLSMGCATGVDGSDNYHLDDGLLMDVTEFGLARKLRGMRSLLKFDPYIDFYHRSFLDFLQDSSRSCQFYISQQNAKRRYLELITDSIVRFASKVIDQPDFHKSGHFCPRFYRISRYYPRIIDLPVKDWQEALQPLLCFQDKLLSLPTFTSTLNLLPCDTCTVFQIMRDLLLHLVIIQGSSNPVTSSVHTEKRNPNGIRSATTMPSAHTKQHNDEDDVDGCIYSLLTELRNSKLEQLINTKTVEFMCSLLCFGHVEIAQRVRSVVDAQTLMDFIDRFINDNYILDQCVPDIVQRTSILALEIYSRVPVLPSSLFSNSGVCPSHAWSSRLFIDFCKLCEGALLGRVLDHNHIVPVLQTYGTYNKILFVSESVGESENLTEWRKTSNPSLIEIIQVILGVARSIRYFHSIGVVVSGHVEPSDIFLDSIRRPKFRYLYSTMRDITETPVYYFINDASEKKWRSYENNVLVFGCIFYEIYFDSQIKVKSSYNLCHSYVSHRLSEPAIREDAWQLIQWCCSDDPKARPTMDQVVQEMESWDLG